MNNTGESNYCCRGWARNGRMSAIINCIISVEDISRQRNCHPCRSPAKQMATKTIHKFARWGAGGDDRRPRMRGPLAFCSANARQKRSTKQFLRKEKESKFEPWWWWFLSNVSNLSIDIIIITTLLINRIKDWTGEISMNEKLILSWPILRAVNDINYDKVYRAFNRACQKQSERPIFDDNAA